MNAAASSLQGHVQFQGLDALLAEVRGATCQQTRVRRVRIDAEGWVQATFGRQDYRPDWFTEIQAQVCGVVIKPEQARANAARIRGWKQ